MQLPHALAKPLYTAYQYSLRDEEFEWDDRKAARNRRVHCVTFELARLVFADPKAIDRLDLDEPADDRTLLTGLVGEVLLTVCITERGKRERIISARRATQREKDDDNNQGT